MSLDHKSQRFTPEERVRLYFLVRDLLPPPEATSFGGETGGEEMWSLYELLQRALGRMDIGEGDGIAGTLHSFIVTASEGDLLTMLELLPLARAQGITKRGSPFEKFTRSDHEHILQSVNQFLGRIGSPARFDQQGRFSRDGFADQAPAGLSALPGKEELRSDFKRLQGEALAIIYFDLDNFKAVNDRNGHAAGDKCLEKVAVIAGTVVAHKGKLYRYGGDEFSIILRNFSASEAAATAERICAAIARANVGEDIAVTSSVGVAATDISGIDQNQLIAAADAAMYRSKESGKNQVTMWLSSTGYAPPKN